jgi:uncharacterized protein (DUF2235 family)
MGRELVALPEFMLSFDLGVPAIMRPVEQQTRRVIHSATGVFGSSPVVSELEFNRNPLRRSVGRNIVIFSDGTGQRGGLVFDERRSNIYKLYRSSRCGPDSCINPAEQLAFYDPGIGTVPGGLGFLGAVGRKIHNMVSQATGLGLTRNIIDCYAAIIRMWEPGDRIFLFGFSRGAYTARCVGAVLAQCGIPTQMNDGKPLRRDDSTTEKIAREAVKEVYQHVSSPSDTKYVPQRVALAARFRTQYGSDQGGMSNAYPHFIGVFDTVAAMANTGSLLVVAALAVAFVALAAGALWFVVSWFFSSSFSYWFWVACVAIVSVLAGAIAYVATHIKLAFGLDGYKWWQTLHFTEARMKFYDRQLNPNVGWARHALAIDEHRADFDRVPWGGSAVYRQTAPDEPDWLQQFWFAGNHSDIGGSYIENESRLSDITLQWMIEAAQKIPNGLNIDRSVLQLYPSPDGVQHDECNGLVFRFARKIDRTIRTDGTLHGSVYERFNRPAVLQYDEMKPYRPEGLRKHEQLKQYY